MTEPGPGRTPIRIVRSVTRVGSIGAAGLLLAVYLAQHLTAPPNASEGGTMLGYVHAIARGQRIHFDFFDYYGPLAWVLPSAFYRAGGETVLGVRIYLLLLKLSSVAITYAFVSRLGRNGLAAALAALLAAALLGQPWPAFHIPYAAHLVYPVVLVAWMLLLDERPRIASGRSGLRYRRLAGLAAAGIVTATVLWIKVTTGAFVLAGGLFHLLYFQEQTASSPQDWRRRLALGLLLGFAVVFHVFIAGHFGWGYLVYLSLPLLIGIAWARRGIVERPERLTGALSATLVYGATTASAWLVIGVANFGPLELWRYVAEQATTLVVLDHAMPFPPLGRQGSLGAFTRFGFPLLPVVTTALFAFRIARFREHAGAAPDATASGAFALLTFHTFVIYARSDEVHLYFAALPAVPVLFTILARDKQGLLSKRASRIAVAGSSILAASPLITLPSADDYAFGRGDWGSPRLVHLRFHAEGQERAYDIDADQAGRHVAELTAPGETVLVLGPSELVNYASDTVPVGGYYRHHFYLLRVGVLDRSGFLELVPEHTLRTLLDDPPRILVDDSSEHSLSIALPEIAQAIAKHPYHLVGKWGLFRVYERPAPEEVSPE